MKKNYLALLLIIISFPSFGQINNDEQKRDSDFYDATGKWFAGWTLVCQDIYQVAKLRPVEFVFFDDKYVYSTSTITIEKGTPVRGPNLMNLAFKWQKTLHHDSLTLPDKSVTPIRLMSFAAEMPNEKNKSFFVMPLPGFWEASGVTSEELGLANLVTGVFIHEFSHSQQMQNFGKSMTAFEKQNNFGVAFSDDIVQDLFSKDSGFVALYKQEVRTLFQGTRNSVIDKAAVKGGLELMKQRQSDYYKDQFSSLTEIDNFFLTMEGLGQYSMYLWMINPKGGNIKKEMAIPGIRRGGRFWSQDEGFSLFLILGKLSKPASWAREMFGDNTVSVVALIKSCLK